ncbi:MAG: hypothetical protein ACRDGS_00790 [Chloroflexota bacterium]
MGLVARALELRGIATVCLATLPGAIAREQPPRVLTVPFERGMTVGPPGDTRTQRAVIEQALTLLRDAQAPGTVVAYTPEAV